MYLFFSLSFRYIVLVLLILWPFSDSKPCIYLIHIFDEVVITFFYFCFTLRCRDEFCLKCFRNTGCQSLLAMNSLLAKLFKSLCYNRFYCIQQASMSWMIYDFSHIFICLLWFCHWLLKGEIVKTYVNHVRNICQYRIG